MAISHTNAIRYKYTSNGVADQKEITVTESGSAEVSISETFGAISGANNTTALTTVEGFEFATASSALSIYIRLDNCDGALAGGASGADAMCTLKDGVPYVWSKNGGVNFPTGATNVMVDATAKLIVTPSANADGAVPVLTVKVLYDSTP